jgi:hypothetical protein
MSSSMRRRSGLTVSADVEVIGELLVLRLEVLNPSILKTGRPPGDHRIVSWLSQPPRTPHWRAAHSRESGFVRWLIAHELKGGEPVPELSPGRMRCSRYGSRQIETRPELYPGGVINGPDGELRMIDRHCRPGRRDRDLREVVDRIRADGAVPFSHESDQSTGRSGNPPVRRTTYSSDRARRSTCPFPDECSTKLPILLSGSVFLRLAPNWTCPGSVDCVGVGISPGLTSSWPPLPVHLFVRPGASFCPGLQMFVAAG